MLDITRMLTDKKFRKETLSYCQDAVVANFGKVSLIAGTINLQLKLLRQF